MKLNEGPKKTKRPWEDFLVSLDTTGDLLEDKNTIDHVKYGRCLRAEMMSKILDETRYIEYSKARNVSFVNRHRHKFSDWVNPNGNLNYKLLFYLSFFGYSYFFIIWN